MVGELNWGAGLPMEIITNMRKSIEEFQNVNIDGYIARNALYVRTLDNPNIRRDVVRRVDMAAAPDGISRAQISAGGTIPDEITTGAKEDIHPIWWIADAVIMNEAEINVDPTRWDLDVRVAMLECQRRENWTAINGDAAHNITGIVAAAQANPRGSIVASGASGNQQNNSGAWDGTEDGGKMDPYEDLRLATGMVNPEFPRSSLNLLGRAESLNYLWSKNEFRETYVSEIAGLFGRADGSTDFLIPCDYVPANTVYVVAKHMNAGEIVIAQDYDVDADYPRQKGKNRYAEIGGWVGFEIHDPSGFVQVAIN